MRKLNKKPYGKTRMELNNGKKTGMIYVKYVD